MFVSVLLWYRDRTQLQSLQYLMAFQINHILSTFFFFFSSLQLYSAKYSGVYTSVYYLFTLLYLGAVTWLQWDEM